MLRKWFSCSLWLLLIVAQSCNSDPCNCEGFYCVSDTEFQLCVNGETVGDRITCNSGLTCRNDTEKECIHELSCQENKACSAEGTFPDEKFIHKYFTCVLDTNTLEWIKNEYTCPENKYFSPEINTCIIRDSSTSQVESDNVKSYGPEEEYSGNNVGYLCPAEGNFPHPRDCQSFYACTGLGTGRLMKCPQDTYYSHELSLCSSEIPETCVSLNVKPEKSSQTENTRNENSFLCPGIGYFADPKNEQRFFVCDAENNALHRYCPENTYFDPASITCAIINSEKPIDSTTDTSVLTKNDKEETLSTINDIDSLKEALHTKYDYKISTTPTEDRVIGTEYPKEEDYYSTTNDFVSTTETSRTDGQERYSFVELSFGERGHQTKTTEYELKLTTPSTPPEEPFVCPGYGYFPDPKNCQGYFACFEFGIAVSIICPEGTYFDERYAFCSSEMPERCTQKEPDESVGPLEPDNEKEFVCPSLGIFPDPKNCHIYWICFNRDFGFFNTCPRGTYYHGSGSICLKEVPERCRGLSDELFKCKNSGYFADPQNCQTYHVCYSYGLHFSIRCPQNTYYDEESKLCTNDVPSRCLDIRNRINRSTIGINTPWITTTKMAVQNTEYVFRKAGQTVEDSTSPATFVCPGRGRFPDPSDCTKYYNCFGPSPRQLSCRTGMYYDEVTKMCGEEFPERCNDTQGNGNDITVPPKTTPAPFVCPGRGRFPDPSDCTKYYNCFGPSPRQLSCRTGMYYDEVTKMCGEEFPERCNDTYGKDANDTTLRPEMSILTVYGTFCPGEGLFVDSEDCSKYYDCRRIPQVRSCPDGTYFNNKTKVCGFEIPVGCKTDSEITTRISSPTLYTTLDQTFECTKPGLYPDPEDCHKYFFCSRKLEVSHLTCRNSMYFNEITNSCGEIIPVRCRSDMFDLWRSSGPSLTPDFICLKRGNFLDKEDRSCYYYCPGKYFKPIRRKCPKDQYFNENKNTCYKMENDDSNSAEESQENSEYSSSEESSENGRFVCKRPGLFPDLQDCRKYYECSTKLKMEHRSCEGHTFFNEDLQFCSYFASRRCRKEKLPIW